MAQIPEWAQVAILFIILGAAFVATKKRIAKRKDKQK